LWIKSAQCDGMRILWRNCAQIRRNKTTIMRHSVIVMRA
jgi:hypothetical protein